MGKLPCTADNDDDDDDDDHSRVHAGVKAMASEDVWRQLGENAMVVEDHDRCTAHRPAVATTAAGVCILVMIV
jgi:hypothetical protein